MASQSRHLCLTMSVSPPNEVALRLSAASLEQIFLPHHQPYLPAHGACTVFIAMTHAWLKHSGRQVDKGGAAVRRLMRVA